MNTYRGHGPACRGCGGPCGGRFPDLVSKIDDEFFGHYRCACHELDIRYRANGVTPVWPSRSGRIIDVEFSSGRLDVEKSARWQGSRIILVGVGPIGLVISVLIPSSVVRSHQQSHSMGTCGDEHCCHL